MKKNTRSKVPLILIQSDTLRWLMRIRRRSFVSLISGLSTTRSNILRFRHIAARHRRPNVRFRLGWSSLMALCAVIGE